LRVGWLGNGFGKIRDVYRKKYFEESMGDMCRWLRQERQLRLME